MLKPIINIHKDKDGKVTQCTTQNDVGGKLAGLLDNSKYKGEDPGVVESYIRMQLKGLAASVSSTSIPNGYGIKLEVDLLPSGDDVGDKGKN